MAVAFAALCRISAVFLQNTTGLAGGDVSISGIGICFASASLLESSVVASGASLRSTRFSAAAVSFGVTWSPISSSSLSSRAVSGVAGSFSLLGNGAGPGCALLGARQRVRYLLLILSEESRVGSLELASMLEGG